MKSYIQRYWFVLALAFAVGFISVAPALLAPIALGDQYQGIQFWALNNEDIYRARIQEVLDGHVMVASPFVYEYKDSPVVVPPINEWFYALPAFFFGLSAAITGSKFLLPAVLFLLVYALIKRMTGGEELVSELTAVTAGLAVALGSDLVEYHALFNIIFHGDPARQLLWTRLVNPISGGVQVFGFALLLWHVWTRMWRFAYIPAGILLASTIGYFFTFGISLAILGALGGVALLRKEYDIVRHTLYVFGIAFVLDLWWWYSIFFALSGTTGSRFAELNGMSFTHMPHFNLALGAATTFVLANFAYAYAQKRWRENIRGWLFIAALLAGGWISINQQIITGREVWYHHFVQYTVPLAILACILALYFSLRRDAPRFFISILIFISAVSVAYGINSTTVYVSRMVYFLETQTYAPLFTWLNENASKNCVVLLSKFDENLEINIPGYTSCNVYNTNVIFSGITEDRIAHNMFVRMRLSGISAEGAGLYLREHVDDEVRRYFFSDWEQQFGHGEEQWILDRTLSLTSGYQEFVRQDLEKEILRYRADYVVSENPLSPNLLRTMPSLEFTTTTGRFHIYSFQ